MDIERLLTIEDLAEILNVSIRTVYRIRLSGALLGTKAGKRVRFTQEQVFDYVRRNTEKPKAKQTVKKTKTDIENDRADRLLRERHGLDF